MPACERTAALRPVHGDLVPRIALREIRLPALRCFTLVDYGDDGPRNLRHRRDRLVRRLGVLGYQVFRDLIDLRNETRRDRHVLPACCVIPLHLLDIDPFLPPSFSQTTET